MTHYHWKAAQEGAWAVLVAVCAYLAQNIGSVNPDDWADWRKLWIALGVGAVRAALGAIVAFAGHRARPHRGTDIPPADPVPPRWES